MIVLSRQHDALGGRISVIVGILLALALVGAVMLGAERFSRILPDALIHFLTRVFGLLLSAIAVQLVVEGVRGTLS